MSANEASPLLGGSGGGASINPTVIINNNNINDPRYGLFAFLEAKTASGLMYERFIITLICINVISFVVASLFVEDYNDAPWAQREGGICNDFCDLIWFGNYRDNGLEGLNLGGATSMLEVVTVLVFTMEYMLRLYTADLLSPEYAGVMGRIRYIPNFFSMVDLASTIPFYVDMLTPNTDIAASSFLRMFRLLRMMRVEGRYDSALMMVDDVYRAQKGLLGTALFVGATTWITVSSLYYLVERRSATMIYCGWAPDYCGDADDINTDLCTIDEWGITNCAAAGCPPSAEYPEPCFNLFQSIPSASYFALLNLFGEYPLIDQHSFGGKIVGTLTAIIAVAVFALPAGIVGNGFEEQIAKRRQKNQKPQQESNGKDDGGDSLIERDGVTSGYVAPGDSYKAYLYNFLHSQSAPGAHAFDYFVNILIVLTALTFMVDSLETLSQFFRTVSDLVEFFAVVVFTGEYIARVYSVTEDPKFSTPRRGRWDYCIGFLPLVDLMSVVPYWMEIFLSHAIVDTTYDTSWSSVLVKSLRLLRIFKFEKYTHAFTSFDDVISANFDVLTVTAFTAVLLWILFGSILYYTERDNPDGEMSSNYSTIPNSMWITLLNLSGESPLCQYSTWGKIATGLCGLFATGIFGIPIGILGAGFEEIVQEEQQDNTEELAVRDIPSPSENSTLGTSLEQWCYKFVNGIGSIWAKRFESTIYVLIFVAVAVGVVQTVAGYENALGQVELVTVLVFSGEYLIRLIGVGADPEFAMAGSTGLSAITCRLHFLISFYSVIDLFAVVPYYVVWMAPGSFVNEYDEYLRMLRIIRLVKLDKYVPSITLIDDVIRLKFNALRVAFFAATTLWVIFAALLFMFEVNDDANEVDPVPKYGCFEDCSMKDRFQNFFDSMVYTGIHLTGDYPIITYSWPSRAVNFCMVIAAVGVVSIPSGLIASGFVEIVQSKTKAKQAREEAATPTPSEGVRAGDDWYERKYRQLEGVNPPPSPWGPEMDYWQNAVNDFLNGKKNADGNTQWTAWSRTSRLFIFTIIIANIAAVVLESVPTIDRAIGNDPGNFFDAFEAFSVMVFAVEYMSRLFSAPKNREALYSTAVYSTTFFGIVDFLSTAPWFFEQALFALGALTPGDDNARIFRIVRMFRILQLEDFVVAFSKLDNVFRASKDVLKATGLMALIIWVGCAALFLIAEENNPNWRHCDASIPAHSNSSDAPGCYDFATTAECNAFYPDMCSQVVFTNMPNTLYLTAVFLGGEWGVVDFTWPGRLVCLFLCVVGIGLYAIPIGALFDSFGAILGLGGDDDEEEDGNDGDA